VGKTSLGQSIARAMGRKFARASLGGVHDEAEIRGHRRTYIGAMPGRVLQAIRRAESNDPVFMLDEVDKIGADWRGDPSSALLEVLDPEQNKDFRDNYLDVPFDLSKVMFITTANSLDTIPPALRDRMEVLNLSGYTEEEKVQIAQRFLIPKQLIAHGLRVDEITVSEEAVRLIIRQYTREAGVRNLEREIASVMRRDVADMAVRKRSRAVVDDSKRVRAALGKRRYYDEIRERIDRPGVATGLVWTPTGGEIIFVEAALTPGKGELKLTGQLGEVMKESAAAALSYLKSRAASLDIDPALFDKNDIHIHVPAGAQPKEGPSAGVTVLTAMASLLTGRPVRDDVAMTGEITLRGRVLPIGGIKEKVLGAHRAGLRRVLLPRRNEADLDDIPADLRKEMQLVLIESIDEVLREALTPRLVAVSSNGAARVERVRAAGGAGGASGAGAGRAAKSARARPSPPSRQAAKARRRRAG
jgi:ATP-dependent Lon protease